MTSARGQRPAPAARRQSAGERQAERRTARRRRAAHPTAIPATVRRRPQPVGVGGEDQERERGSAAKRDGISRAAAALLVAVVDPEQHRRSSRRARDRSAARARSPATAPVASAERSARRAPAWDRRCPPPRAPASPAASRDGRCAARHEHAVGRTGEEQGEERERIGARVDQPARGQAVANSSEQIRQQRRDRDRPALAHRRRRGTAEAAGSARRAADRPAATNGCSAPTAGSAGTGEDRYQSCPASKRADLHRSAYCRRYR